jgi:hypothetical protein
MLLREIISQKLFETPAGAEFDVRNTLFFKILRANPLLARFYADLFRRHGANPSIIRDLETRSPNFSSSKKGPNMPANRTCTHIKVNGIRCGSPSLRGEVFCYFHQRMLRGVRTPPKSRLHPIANFEDPEAIQASLMEVVNALIRNHIDVARARLILRALSIAASNAPKVRFGWSANEMVNQVPEYPAAPSAVAPLDIAPTQAAPKTSITKPKQDTTKKDMLTETTPNQPSRSALATEPADVHSNVPRDANRRPPTSAKTEQAQRPKSNGRAG